MKKIIDIKTKEEISLDAGDLPMMIHGVEHSGASLMSISIAANLHMAGSKLLIFTAYNMAIEEFTKQVGDPESIFYLEREEDIEKALSFRTIFVQSGNAELFAVVADMDGVVADRLIFIKNIETVNIPIFNLVVGKSFIVSGDLGANKIQHEFKTAAYNTKIFMSLLEGETVPTLEKYQAYIKNQSVDTVATLV